MDWLRIAFRSRNESKSADENNGLILNGIAIPEEIIILILSYVDLKNITNCKLVCKAWNEIIQSHHFWKLKLNYLNKITRKNLPWYVNYCHAHNNVFDINLLKNGNGENIFKYWKIKRNGGDGWIVEDTPQGADGLPENLLEFNGKSSCFATSFGVCSKHQIISFKNNKLVRKILNDFKPTIYISEWFAGRFDCGCVYELRVRLYNSERQIVYEKTEKREVEQWLGSEWSKVEIKCEDYGSDVTEIQFYHWGQDTKFWKGHYGSKMAGGIVKISFDSIKTKN